MYVTTATVVAATNAGTAFSYCTMGINIASIDLDSSTGSIFAAANARSISAELSIDGAAIDGNRASLRLTFTATDCCSTRYFAFPIPYTFNKRIIGFCF